MKNPPPDRLFTLVVPFAADGPTDVVARMPAIPTGKSLGQSVVAENAVGAGGSIAATEVARSAPNGYTVFIHHLTTAPALHRKPLQGHRPGGERPARRPGGPAV